MQETALVALAVAAVVVAALVWAYFQGKLNSFLPASWQHKPAAAAAPAAPASSGFYGGCSSAHYE
jgi:hypothetical protein